MLRRDFIFAVRDRRLAMRSARPVSMVALVILIVFLAAWCNQLSRLQRKAQRLVRSIERTDALLEQRAESLALADSPESAPSNVIEGRF